MFPCQCQAAKSVRSTTHCVSGGVGVALEPNDGRELGAAGMIAGSL